MDFMERLQQGFAKGLSSSRDLYGKAKGKAKELGEKGLLHLELQQLERQVEELVGQLGAKAYEHLTKGGAGGVTLETEGVKGIVNEINRVRGEIEEREEALRNLR